jgi:hypothetical protein
MALTPSIRRKGEAQRECGLGSVLATGSRSSAIPAGLGFAPSVIRGIGGHVCLSPFQPSLVGRCGESSGFYYFVA